MTYHNKLKWVLAVVFCVGFVAGQDYHTGFAAFVGFLIRLALWCFVIYTALNVLHTNRADKKVRAWKDPQSQPRMKPSNKGMDRTVAAVAGATGTHVAVLDPQSPSQPSEEPPPIRIVSSSRRRELEEVVHPDAGFDR